MTKAKAKTTKSKTVKNQPSKAKTAKKNESTTTSSICIKCGCEMKYFGTAKVYTKCSKCR